MCSGEVESGRGRGGSASADTPPDDAGRGRGRGARPAAHAGSRSDGGIPRRSAPSHTGAGNIIFSDSKTVIRVSGLDALRRQDEESETPRKLSVKRTLCFNDREMLLHHLIVCQADASQKVALKLYVQELKRRKALTVTIVTPGGFGHLTVSTAIELKNVLRELYHLIKSLHKAGFALSGQFGLNNFAVQEQGFRFSVKFFDIPQELLQKINAESGTADCTRLVMLLRREIFDGDKIDGSMLPHDMTLWINMLQQNHDDVLLGQSVLLLNTEEQGRRLMEWYDELVGLSEESDAYTTICEEMRRYANWRQTVESDDGNELLKATLHKKDNVKPYKNTFKDLLRLLRNCRNHQALHMHKDFAAVASHHFPNLISDFQRALQKARLICPP